MNEYQAQQLLDKADFYEGHGQWLHAAQMYLRLLAAEPHDIRWYLKLATVYVEMQNYQAAEQTLLNALSKDSGNSDILYGLGMVFYNSTEFDRALYYFEQIARLKLPEAHFRMGLIYLRQDNYIAAERHLNLTLELDPRMNDAYIVLGEVLLKSSQAQKALAVLQKSLDAEPMNWKAHMLMAFAYQRLNRKEDSMNTYRLLASLYGTESKVLQLVADALLQIQEFDEAELVLQKAYHSAPHSAEVLVRLGKVSLFKSDRSAAEKFFLQALAADPGCLEAEQHLELFIKNAKKKN